MGMNRIGSPNSLSFSFSQRIFIIDIKLSNILFC